MSITSIIDYNNPNFKGYRTSLRKIQKPKINNTSDIKIYPKTLNYAIVGSAYDYLFRFTLERNFPTFIKGKKNWVSENAIRFLENDSIISDDVPSIENHFQRIEKKKELYQQVKSRFEYIQKVFYFNYINGYSKLDNEIIGSCLFLAKLDYLVRTGYDDLFDWQSLFYEDKDDIEDLKQLINSTDFKKFKPRSRIILNPVFGVASKLVGGADADLIIDSALIDIKASKQLIITRQYFNQILSYYFLHLIESRSNGEEITIKKLGFYFARFSKLIVFSVASLNNPEYFDDSIEILKDEIAASKIASKTLKAVK